MSLVTLTKQQLTIVQKPIAKGLFLEGVAGTGKTTTGVHRLLFLIDQGVPADSILVIAPLRTLAVPYYDAIRQPNMPAGGFASIVTIGGLARRMIDLFWPLIAKEAGFATPEIAPIFLTLETAQYHMARVIRPCIEGGCFESVAISRNRLYSQIIDNLNKAAVVGFPYTEIGKRLTAAWAGDSARARVYEDAQKCATLFREFCIENNLLDFSLQIEVFMKHVWTSQVCRQYLIRTYRHLIVDNIEEDTPIAHDLLREWMPFFDSALIIYDQEAGYRAFLGSSPSSGLGLKEFCAESVAFDHSFVSSIELQHLSYSIRRAFNRKETPAASSDRPQQNSAVGSPFPLFYGVHRYLPEMLDWVAERIADLINGGASPGSITVLAPYLGDALRFAITIRLEKRGIPSRSHRPSRALRDEPTIQCLLTLGALAHPQWGIKPTKFEIAYALITAIEGMDLVRARLLAEMYRSDGSPPLPSFDQIVPESRDRITYRLGTAYELLRSWVISYASHPEEEIDYFYSRLFGEALSMPGFRIHGSFGEGVIIAKLIESAKRFRLSFRNGIPSKSLGREYSQMVQDGLFGAQYLQSWQIQPIDAVLLVPAHTFLMANYPVDYEFWIDIGNRGWHERLYQPLTHPYVLAREWEAGKVWTDTDELVLNQDRLYGLMQGLVRRCRRGIYLGVNELSEDGYESRGQLILAVQRVLRTLAKQGHVVKDAYV